ncbi:MAG: DUF4012 domain-containing protein [Acidimicrobiia bacterium]|nr:DUF4012 domain-containing protein [Acidimicrobiia bacterium]
MTDGIWSVDPVAVVGTDEDTTERQRRREVIRTSPARRAIIAGACGAGAVLVVAAGPSPTGVAVTDVAWSAAFGAGVVWASSRARRWSWSWMAGLAALASGVNWPWTAFALAALVGAWSGVFMDKRDRLLGAGIGVGSVAALVHLEPMVTHGIPTLVTAAAVVPVFVSAYRGAGVKLQRNLRRGTLVAAAVLVGLAGVGAVVAATALPTVVRAGDDARDAADALRGGDQDGAAALFASAEADFESAHARLRNPLVWPTALAPIASQQVQAVADVADAGAALSSAAYELTTAAPYRDLKSEAGRVDLALLASMTNPVDNAAATIDAALATVTEASTPWLVGPLANRVEDFYLEVADTAAEVELAQAGLAVAPGLLGGEEPRTYLLLFTTPTEAREPGGFVGSWGELQVTNGDLDLVETGRAADFATELPDGGLVVPPDSAYATRYVAYGPQRFFQNVTMSPDVPTAAVWAADAYAQLTGTEVDGVAVIDPTGLAALLELTGPVTVDELDGRTFDADTVEQYLWLDQYVEFDGEVDERSDALADLAEATFEELTTGDLPDLRTIAGALGPATRAGHLAFVPFDDDEAEFFERFGALRRFDAGRTADWLAVRSTNNGANKIDSFLERELTYELELDPVGGVAEARATVTLTNTAPSEGLPRYVIGNNSDAPWGTNLTTLSLYTPLTVVTATLDGQPVAVGTDRAFGGWVHDVRLAVPPGESVTVVFDLSGQLSLADGYVLALDRQPLVHDDEVAVTVDLVEAPGTRSAVGGSEAGTWLEWAGPLHESLRL